MIRENLQTSFSKQHESKRHLLITNSKQDLVGVVGMGGATKKLKQTMPAERFESEYQRFREFLWHLPPTAPLTASTKATSSR